MGKTVIIENGLSDFEFFVEFLSNTGLFAGTFEEERAFRVGVELVLNYLGQKDVKKKLLLLESFESRYTERKPRNKDKVLQLVFEFLEFREKKRFDPCALKIDQRTAA